MTNQSLPPTYFDKLYAADPDPWDFETSEYEAQKYAATIAALPNTRYQSAFEIGGSIGVLTEQLAGYCDSLLSVDISTIAQATAIQRCQHLPHVRFQIMNVPHEYPNASFDLVVLSEVGYYWCWDDFKQSQTRIFDSLLPGGHLLLVHWLHEAIDYPLRGHQVHDAFQEFAESRMHQRVSQRTQDYRLDVYEKR